MRMPINKTRAVVKSLQNARLTADKLLLWMMRLIKIPEVDQHREAVTTRRILDTLDVKGVLGVIG
jgi:hypothetical protein